MRHLTDLLVSRSVPTEERKAYYYELLARETERLHRMVESLLSFGRMEAGAYAWQLEPTDATTLVRTIVDDFRAEPLATHRRLVCEIDEELPAIHVDREALSRAFWNLLENAGKYSEPDSPIRVFAHHQGDSILIGVSDEGIGIPAGERDKIFQKFVRGADAKRAGVRGVGIGLALVQRIVEAHGGSVQVDSQPGRGSTFTIVLPAPAAGSGLGVPEVVRTFRSARRSRPDQPSPRLRRSAEALAEAEGLHYADFFTQALKACTRRFRN